MNKNYFYIKYLINFKKGTIVELLDYGESDLSEFKNKYSEFNDGLSISFWKAINSFEYENILVFELFDEFMVEDNNICLSYEENFIDHEEFNYCVVIIESNYGFIPKICSLELFYFDDKDFNLIFHNNDEFMLGVLKFGNFISKNIENYFEYTNIFSNGEIPCRIMNVTHKTKPVNFVVFGFWLKKQNSY